jgi:hypothetical protein
MDNIRLPEDEFKLGELVDPQALGALTTPTEKESCGSVAAGVAAAVADQTAHKSLIGNGVADVAAKPELRVLGRPSEAEDGAALLDEITEGLLRHVVMPLMHAQVCALWVIHAQTIDAHRHSPRLAITSPIPNCGKTTLCSAIAVLTGVKVVSNATIAAFFRMIDKDGPRLIILDEADTFLSAENRGAIGILNSGHARAGANVIRTEGTTNGFEPKTYCVWAPVVFGLIGKLPAASLESRSISISLKRKRRNERVELLRPADEQRLRDLLARAIRWGAQHFAALREAHPCLPDCLYNRDQDNWRPLIAIADEAGGHWPQTAREIAQAMNGLTEDPSEGVKLLADIRRAFEQEQVNRLSTQRLIEILRQDEQRPWHDYQDQGAPIESKQLARLLRVFGIRPSSVRIGDATPKGYMLEWFEDAFDRYLPDPLASAAATSATASDFNIMEPQQEPQRPPLQRNNKTGDPI